MPKFVATDRKCYFQEYDLSGWFSANELKFSPEPQDSAVWGSDTRTYKNGLNAVTFSGSGLADSDAGGPEPVLKAGLGLEARVVTYSPVTGAEGEYCYSFGSLWSQLQPFGSNLGEMSKFNIAGVGSGGKLFRGIIDLPKASRTSSGNGAGRQLGAVAANRKLYSVLHVFTVTGTSPTLDVVVESDDNAGFSSPTTRITHTQATGITAEMLSLNGALTDDYYRVTYTIGGTTPDFTFFAAIGIGW